MASADFSQFVITTDRAPPVRPHGISPEPFPVYSPDLRIEVTVAFWTLMRFAILSVQYALISDFCSSSHGFAIASSRLYLTIQTLQVALRFVGNYAPRDFHPRFGACPSYKYRGSGNSEAPVFLPENEDALLSLSYWYKRSVGLNVISQLIACEFLVVPGYVCTTAE